MARANGRQVIVRDDTDRQRLLDELEGATSRAGWIVYAFVVLSNHFHVVLKTPQPNLARGMQTFLSSYANAKARRSRFGGHVFQGRYRSELVEDETYLWSVTRYVHLNPVRAGLVDRPEEWPWSSFPGYARRAERREWVSYDELLASRGGAFGGSDPGRAYRSYVASGLAAPPESPWSGAHQGWLLGSEAFAERVRRIVRGESRRERRRESRLVQGLPLSRVREVVCRFFEVGPAELARRGSRSVAREALAYLARRHTTTTHRELAVLLGLQGAECVPNLTRRLASRLDSDAGLRRQIGRLEKELVAAGNV
jgi:REP element-mobilizing transposase RayT